MKYWIQVEIVEELFQINILFFSYLILNINLLGDGKCECVEHALPARDCFNDEILADNCLWS